MATAFRIRTALLVSALVLPACHQPGLEGEGAGASGGGSGGLGGTSGFIRDGGDTMLVPDGAVLGKGQIAAYSCQQKKFPQEYTCQGDQTSMWAELLQKALWFFHVNELGDLKTCTYVQWRGPAHDEDAKIPLVPAASNKGNGVDMSAAFIEANRKILDPDGNGTVDLRGGFHDAGDFIKFGLTTAFSASTMAWSYLEFPDSYKTTGLEGELRVLLRSFADYFIRSTFRDSDGRVVAFAHQVGGPNDHTCGWMPPELRRTRFCSREAYFSTDENPSADVAAFTAAALAQISMAFLNDDKAYAAKCLDYAKALYEHAAKYPGTKSHDSGGLYDSEYSWDDLAFGALTLYEATGEKRYLEEAFNMNEGKAGGWIMRTPAVASGDWGLATSECWTQCWNSVRSGSYLKLAIHLDEMQKEGTLPSGWEKAVDGFRKVAFDDSNKWPTGSGPQTSPGGFNVLAAYGSGRYNSAGQFIALVYDKYFNEPTFVSWAKRQIEYLAGDNPLEKSYIMGYSDKYATQPHHAAGHASLYGEPDKPVENRHIVWGALVNGPDGDDKHVDKRSDYGANEITIDYNASLLAALAANYAHHGAGTCPLRTFPPIAPGIAEFYTRAKINSESSCRSQIEISMINESIHPPGYDSTLSARYYFDLAELGDVDPSKITATLIYDRGKQEWNAPTSISEVKYCGDDEDGNKTTTYYVEMAFPGEFWGEMTQLQAPRTVILDVGVDYAQSCSWDISNDWSHKDLTKDSSVKTQYIPVYSEGKLIFGKQPPCAGEGQQEVVRIVL